ncbi:hypothetical protein NDU88_003684 [Pleurodeles waltl]|uniref:Uncharacterized protein n=1 Tax=Pleurodeles waltl TaxID=8319 RepID=A0AAV7UCS8_PLEWA|nr:hypothetical protein NDU88_003684 [Pleurodeles waltl]
MSLPARQRGVRRRPRGSGKQATPIGAAPMSGKDGGRVAVITGVREEDSCVARWTGRVRGSLVANVESR